jgi:16S rRNA C967 or C1407 C5-methylase (RsmB/RsmF family)
MPKSLIQLDSEECRLNFYIRDALNWKPEMQFDKVLADVPCTNDRLSVNFDENNIFTPGKVREREILPEYQAHILYRAYRMCRPGGSVVYSTCSLSPSQNDGVIRRLFENMTKIDPHEPRPVISSLSSLQTMFGEYMSFHPDCQYGIQVIPSLQANFGPMYICKLKKPV